jgi:hypothetical protein
VFVELVLLLKLGEDFVLLDKPEAFLLLLYD